MPKGKSVDVLLELDRESDVPIYQQIYAQIGEEIRRGALGAGSKLPPIRRLSQEFCVSHTTVEQAYLQLSVEGYVRNVPRSGYVVEELDTEFLQLERHGDSDAIPQLLEARNRDAFYAENDSGGRARYDFSFANLPPDSFPVRTWRKLLSDVLYADVLPDLARYTYTDEPNAFSRALAAYLQRTRGVSCVPEQVLPQAGTDGALATVLQLFDREKDVIGMEEPGYENAREVATRLGFRLVPLPTDQGDGSFVDAVRQANPKIVFCTPSHQFPTGNVLLLEKRIELLKWASETGGYIIEDDSCNEYRYDVAPLPSLQSLDAHGRVIYLCNFSKVLSPSMRFAYLVLPPDVLERYFSLYNYAHPQVPWLQQEVMARFISEGYLDQHVRRMTKDLHARHDILLDCLREAFGERIALSGEHAGMHFYVTVRNDMDQRELLRSALREGAAVYGTDRMWFSQPAPGHNVMVGFSSIAKEDIPAGAAALKRAWFPQG